MSLDLFIDSIIVSPHNSRTRYEEDSVSRLAHSLKENGQLVRIRVRPSERYPGKYDIVYGHRRFLAAKKLGWKTIKAEIESVTEEQMAAQSLIENIERENLSDYEKALFFREMNTRFEMTYQQIGRIIGASKQSVANYMSMLKLFTEDELNRFPDLRECLLQITEHHSRILARVQDFDSKADLTRKIVGENLSIRDLANIVNKLRSWFTPDQLQKNMAIEPKHFAASSLTHSFLGNEPDIEAEKQKVKEVIIESYQLAKSGDYEAFKRTHAMNMGYNLYTLLSSADLREGQDALDQERLWFSMVSKVSWRLKDIKINIFDSVAIVTLTVIYSGLYVGSKSLNTRGTVVLIKKEGSWKVFHEHYSQFPEDRQQNPIVSTTEEELFN